MMFSKAQKNKLIRLLLSEKFQGLNLKIICSFLSCFDKASASSIAIFNTDVFPVPHFPYTPITNPSSPLKRCIASPRYFEKELLCNRSFLLFSIGLSAL